MRRRFMGIILIILGAAALVVGIVMVSSRPSETEAEVNFTKGSQKVNSTTPDSNSYMIDEAKAKGNCFEDYVANIFKDRSVFRVKNWYQGVTSSEGVYAESNLNPDFEIEQTLYDNFRVKYWIECKYRSAFKNGELDIDDWQIDRYKNSQRESHQKVLLAIGVGGSAASPSSFYLVPVDSIRGEKISPAFLSQFQLSDPHQNFAQRISDYFQKEVFPAARERKREFNN